ncbi:MAG TPA: hypothetical protein VJQ43_04105 [Thermoplasmata archaeon]|nr:hypothetical protein [Thermoplasmata archaeon]
MKEPRPQPLRGFTPRAVRDGGIVALLAALLGLLSGLPLGWALGVPTLAVVVSLSLRGFRSPALQEYGLVPVLVALGALALAARPSVLVGVLAALTGLAVLLWYADTPGERPRTDPVGGLLLPGLGVGVTLLAALALPGANAAVGLAAVAIAGALSLVVWALVRVLDDPTAAGESI